MLGCDSQPAGKRPSLQIFAVPHEKGSPRPQKLQKAGDILRFRGLNKLGELSPKISGHTSLEIINGTPGLGTQPLLEGPSMILSLALMGYLLRTPGKGGTFSDPLSPGRPIKLASNSRGMQCRICLPAGFSCYPCWDPAVLAGSSNFSNMLFQGLQKGSCVLLDYVSLNIPPHTHTNARTHTHVHAHAHTDAHTHTLAPPSPHPCRVSG